MDIVYYSKSLSVGSGEIKKNWKSVTVESDLQLLDFRIFDERKDEALPERVQVADDQRRKEDFVERRRGWQLRRTNYINWFHSNSGGSKCIMMLYLNGFVQ